MNTIYTFVKHLSHNLINYQAFRSLSDYNCPILSSLVKWLANYQPFYAKARSCKLLTIFKLKNYAS